MAVQVFLWTEVDDGTRTRTEWTSHGLYVRMIIILNYVLLFFMKRFVFLHRVLDLLDSLEEQDTDDGKSVYNVNEARLIALAIKTIIQNPAVRTKQIGVITYYQKQKQTIIDKIKEE